MFTIKTIGPDGQTAGYEATRFTINEGRSILMIQEPSNRVLTDLDVTRPDGLNHIYIESAAGKTIETLHRGGVKKRKAKD